MALGRAQQWMTLGGLVVLVSAVGCAGANTPVPTAGNGSTSTSDDDSDTDEDTRGNDDEQPDDGVDDDNVDDNDDADGPGSTDDDAADTTTAAGSDDSGCPPGESGCACDDGACDFGLMCIEQMCTVAGSCGNDTNEDNNDEASATVLAPAEDCDARGGMAAGVLDGDDDVDWFRYDGDDTAGCVVDPERTLAANGTLRLCKFVECQGNLADTEITCPEGVTQSISPDGRPGCCSDDGFAFDDIDCPGIDDDAAVYLRVDQPGAMCVAYTIAYHY